MGRGKKKKSSSGKGKRDSHDDDEDYEPRSQGKKKGGEGKAAKRANGKKRNKHNNGWVADDSFRRQVEADGTKMVVEMAADGNCLFRSLSDQLYYDYGNKHEEVREEVCDFIAANEEDFIVFLVLDQDDDKDAANFEEYVSIMREHGEWGGNLELVAAGRLYRRNIKVFSVIAAYTINVPKPDGPDLMVSYHDNDHYNSVRETAGTKPPPPKKFMPLGKPEKKQEPNDVAEMPSNDALPTKKRKQKGNQDENEVDKDTTELPTDQNGEAGLPSGDENEAKLPTTRVRAKKKGGKCPCGSGLSYRKCCRDREKKEKAARRTKLAKEDDETVATTNEDEQEAEGSFKVLRI